MHERFVKYLFCPESKASLTLKSVKEREGCFIREGVLVSELGREYPIRGFIPRFTEDDYASNFTFEWEKHPTILDELTSGYSLYRTRFSDETKWEEDLSGQLVLEAGCGPGSLTLFPRQRGATVVSFDMSGSVDVAQSKLGLSENGLIVQASIFAMPFRDAQFDKCFCFGVLQHTPDPRAAFQHLANVIRGGGKLAADSYISPNSRGDGGHRILRAKYRFRRVLPKMSPKALHWLVRQYVKIFFPIASIAQLLPSKLGSAGKIFMKNFLIDDYRARLPGMEREKHKEFAVLDIFDFLSPMYDIPQSENEFRGCFERARMVDVDVHPGYNGIEGRGTKPLS